MLDLFEPLKSTDRVSFDMHRLSTIPEGTSVYKVDEVRSGVPLTKGWEVMFEHKDALTEIVLYNSHTGQRQLIGFSPAEPKLRECVLVPREAQDKAVEGKGLIFRPQANHGAIPAKWTLREVDGQAQQYDLNEIYVEGQTGIFIRGDVFYHDEKKAVAMMLTELPAGQDRLTRVVDNTREQYLKLRTRFERLTGRERAPIHNDFPNQSVFAVKLGDE